MNKAFYITTPIYYVNDKPHIGHMYTSLACDVIARFKRLDGYDVHFVTGTDEHGQKIQKAASKLSITCQDFVDNLSQRFMQLLSAANISNDYFIRTSETRHKAFVQNIWKQLIESDNIYLGSYNGWYSVRDEAFYHEDELINGLAPTGATVEWVEEESYFFRLSKWQQALLDFYKHNPDFISPKNRYNEVISLIEKDGLRDLSVSRISVEWGIPVPNNAKHTIYVWLDALCNYLSALQNTNNGYQKYWPCNLHIIGKDILRFHAIYWPAFLMALDIPLPKKIFAHGWWTNNGEKMSKSLGNTIDPHDMIKEYGTDYVRYFMMREVPFGNDGNYSQDALISRINADLANNIGNLVQRVTSLVHRHFNAVIPNTPSPKSYDDADNALLNSVYESVAPVRQHIDNQSIHLALEHIISIANSANIYIDRNAPWKLIKTHKDRAGHVLYILLESIRVIAILLQPFIPQSARNILLQIGIVVDECTVPFAHCSPDYAIKSKTPIPTPSVIFKKLL